MFNFKVQVMKGKEMVALLTDVTAHDKRAADAVALRIHRKESGAAASECFLTVCSPQTRKAHNAYRAYLKPGMTYSSWVDGKLVVKAVNTMTKEV